MNSKGHFADNALKPSTVAVLKAVRENDMGVFLDAQDRQYLR